MGRRWLGVKQPKEYCWNGGKTIYDKRGAITARNARWKEEHLRLRAYPCPHCDGWHLTKELIRYGSQP